MNAWFVQHGAALASAFRRLWLAPLNTLLSLLVITLVYHSQLGIQVVVEDYVASKGTRVLTMLVVNFVHVLLGALGVFAVLRVAFGAAV